ncbi:MAG: ABC transporter permease [Kiritimatiellae bacterium]|nr:ABC transporter permease [Kiritimatiellia bacterium]
MGVFESIGRGSVERLRGFHSWMSFLGETVVCAVTALIRPRQFRLRDCALAFQRSTFDGLPISTGIGFLLGVILAFQSAAALKQFGVEVYISDLLTIALFRELGPLVTAIILAGRSGSAFAAEIGVMKVDEELDALTTMGLPPVRFLVLPRVVAAMLAMPVLTIFAELAGLIGGAIVLDMMNVPNVVFWRHVTATANSFMILLGLAKGAVFGMLVGLIGCSSGMRASKTSDGVGTATTAAVVGGIIAIAVSDGLLAVLCYIWKI